MNTNPLITQIQIEMNKQTELRNELHGHHKKQGVIFFIFIAIAVLFLFFSPWTWLQVVGLVGSFLLGVFFVIVYSTKHNIGEKETNFQNDYKHKIIEPILKQSFGTDKVTLWTHYGDDPKDRPYDGLTVLRNSKLFAIGNECGVDDETLVQYKGKNISFFDVSNAFRSGSGEDETYIPIFHGQVCVVPISKKVDTPVRIVDENYKERLTTEVRRNKTVYMSGKNKNTDKASIHTENPEFDKAFNIFCDNEASAFYVLTPQYMETLLQLRNNMHRKMIISIIGNLMYVGFYTEVDMFEADFKNPLPAQELYLKTCNEIYPIKLLAEAVI